MLSKLPFEVQCLIFRNYISCHEKIKLLKMEEFYNILTTKYAWKTLPKLSLKTYAWIAQNYLNILSPGLYMSKNSKTLYEIFIKEETGVLSLNSYVFGNNFSSTRVAATTEFTISDLQNILEKIKNTSIKITAHSYFNDQYYMSFNTPVSAYFAENTVYENTEQLMCYKGKHLFIMKLIKCNNPIKSWTDSEIKYRFQNFMQKKECNIEKHCFYEMLKLTHWRSCMKLELKVTYKYKPRSKKIEAKGVRRLIVYSY